MSAKSVISVQSPVGKKRLDGSGSVVGAARMNPADGYGPVPALLKEYIDSGSEKAWREICRRIDSVYAAVSSALESLDAEAPFSGEVKRQVEVGKTLFLKPNLVIQPIISFRTHAPSMPESCTPWEFVAAVMRWFHDRQGVTYHQMAVGEAGTAVSAAALMASKIYQTEYTTQALMEGKCGDNYGGWGFYFARKYLAECHDPAHTDDPMRGYEESVSGVCLPVGRATDKLTGSDFKKQLLDACDENGDGVIDY